MRLTDRIGARFRPPAPAAPPEVPRRQARPARAPARPPIEMSWITYPGMAAKPPRTPRAVRDDPVMKTIAPVDHPGLWGDSG